MSLSQSSLVSAMIGESLRSIKVACTGEVTEHSGPRSAAPRAIPHQRRGRRSQRAATVPRFAQAKRIRRERADKGKELHADADLGETMGALRECFEPHRRAPAFRVPVGALSVSANRRRRRSDRSMKRRSGHLPPACAQWSMAISRQASEPPRPQMDPLAIRKSRGQRDLLRRWQALTTGGRSAADRLR